MKGRASDYGDTLDSVDGYRGRAVFYNINRLKDYGYDIHALPYSIKVLLENVLRFTGKIEGAEKAVEHLAQWPRSIGSELPFMPYRVLLQDYTGVPLIVDLTAMRGAIAKHGRNPQIVNSKVPVDLIIDHSVQVDSWSTNTSFALNIEKEYERNGERYALLKWAQESFKGMRIFPPGKGICHQVNLEYLATVVALHDSEGRLAANPDTLVGTDSHTTMVNGLGVLGWGVGGIEAEAVMLGEPYHMQIPRVVGVKITGELQEGATPTDIVLTVTELLRKRNVVEAFVEYFGDGYSRLTVPDRATLGNMSPEYGATVGYSPVDEATITYLLQTGRESGHADFVRRYCKLQGLFVDPQDEPRYTDVLELDLSKIEPSLAGPRNPDERRSLRSVPAFANALLQERRRARATRPLESGAQAGTPVSVSGKQLVAQSASGLIDDGSVVIAAITSCTNTSNPTVMVGAGLLARNAVLKGLMPKPHVKCSLAPGSTVVRDYLEGSRLLPYLDKIGFNLVGYGCTTCIAQGTPVSLADGTTRPIESMPAAGGALVFGPTPNGKLGIARQSKVLRQGIRECVRLVLQDGRSLTCTPDHQILCSNGRWVRADRLVLGKARVIVGLDGPLDNPCDDESGYVLHAGDLIFTMRTQLDRARTLAFARLVGHLLGDGSISVLGQGRMHVGQALDREEVLNDVELLTGLRPAANRYDERRWSIVLPMALAKVIIALPGAQVGRRIDQPPRLPAFVYQNDCPVAVVREFLGGLFGADGHAPVLHRWGRREEEATLEPPAYSRSTIPAHLEATKEFMRDIIRLLMRCGVKSEGARVYEYPTRRSSSSYPAAQDGIPRTEVRLELPNGLSFVESVGFRYCVDKSMRASAAAVYWRLLEGIQEQRLWMAARLEELHRDQPPLSFSRARQLLVASLLDQEREVSLPPVVSPHYALLEGYDRFSRLPKASDRKFQPLHRESCDFPSPIELFEQLGVREWFALLGSGSERQRTKRYCIEKEAMTIPTFSLQVVDRHPAGRRLVYDITVENLHAFMAGTVAVHNCIGNSGPLAPEIEREIKEKDSYVVAVLSGNRNFDGRIHPLAKGAFLTSPMLVVAYALAGRMDFDFYNQRLGRGPDGRDVYLKDIWPSLKEIKQTIEKSLSPDLYRKRYADALVGDEKWKSLSAASGGTYRWDSSSTYIKEPPWFETSDRGRLEDIWGARVLALLEDKVTTDHISPAGTISVDSPAALYLQQDGVEMIQFSTYGTRRGNHEVMVRGGFSNIRLKNLLAKGREGGYTTFLPTGEIMPIYDAAMEYNKKRIPLIVIAGKGYGAGSSRDWAAKAPKLLGVKAVIAESFERIHRSNLVAMGILPLEFADGKGAKGLGLKGDEEYFVEGLKSLKPRSNVNVRAKSSAGELTFRAVARIDNMTEMQYYLEGGVLPYVFNKIAA